MPRRPDHGPHWDTLVVPTIPDLGGFDAKFCTRCAYTLVPGFVEYREGPVCRACDAEIQRGFRAMEGWDEHHAGGEE